jgi:hypothetical protein
MFIGQLIKGSFGQEVSFPWEFPKSQRSKSEIRRAWRPAIPNAMLRRITLRSFISTRKSKVRKSLAAAARSGVEYRPAEI